MNRRRFVKWLMRLPPSVWVAANWLPEASESTTKTIEVVMFRRPGWGIRGQPRHNEKGQELWYPLSPADIQKFMNVMRLYNPRGSWEESMRALEALAEPCSDSSA